MHLVRRDLLLLPLPKKDLFKTITKNNLNWPIEDKK